MSEEAGLSGVQPVARGDPASERLAPPDVLRVPPAEGAPLPPPRAAAVLAAGRSERLRAVTGGGSKALVRVAGLPLIERAVRRLAQSGFERIVVVVGYHAGPVAAIAQRAAPGRVRVVVAKDWEAGNGASLAAAEPALSEFDSFLLVTVDHLFADGALDDLLRAGQPAILVDPSPSPDVWDEATRVEIDGTGRVTDVGKDVMSPLADCGAFLLGPDVFDAGRRARAAGDATLSGTVTALAAVRRVAAVPLRSTAWWQDVDTPADLRQARRYLRGSLRRETDGPVSRLLNRRMSIPISWALAPLRPSPDLLSIVAFLTGIAAAISLGAGFGLAGGLLAQACSVLDGVDGEVARLTERAGSKGALLDGFLDRLSDGAILAGMAIAALAETGAALVLVLGVAATAGAMLSMATKDRVAALRLEPPDERRIAWLFGGRDGRLLVTAVFAIAGLPTWGLGVIAATSLVSSALRVLFARGYPEE